MVEAARPFWRSLYFWVLVAITLGVLVGWLWPETGRSLKPLGDGFIKLVKMIITPVIFLTVVTGIAGMADLKAFGRVGLKAMAYFLTVSTFALAVGLAVANVVRPGEGLNVDPRTLDAGAVASYVDAGARADRHRLHPRHHSGHARQRLHLGRDPAGAARRDPVRDRARTDRRERRGLLALMRSLTAIVFRIVHILMYLAPLGAFGAMAYHDRPIWHRARWAVSRFWSPPSTRPRSSS